MKYFAYGMNTNTKHMARMCYNARKVGVGWINDYEMVFRGHADIQPSPNHRCYGVVWDITHSDLAELDRLEGYPSYYIRFLTTVYRDGFDPEEGWVYQMAAPKRTAAPAQSYLDMVNEGYQENGLFLD